MFFRSSLVALLFAAAPIWAATDSLSALEKAAPRPAEGITDNSFLIEEAYNQEPGVVQHILNVVHTVSRHAGPDERALSFIFTEEWPVFTQAHQFSYTLPYTFLDVGGSKADGIGDCPPELSVSSLDGNGHASRFRAALLAHPAHGR